MTACESGVSCTKDSQVWSFTTTSVASGTGVVATGTGGAVNPCPTGNCVVASGSVTVAYMGCSNINSTNPDCATDTTYPMHNFGTSERNYANDATQNSYYGQDKSLTYQITNPTNGTAYFKVRLGSNTSAMTEKSSTTGFDTDQAYDFGGEGIANNLYWTTGAGCANDATRGYKIVAQSSCWIMIHARSDMNWDTVLGVVGGFQVYNTDTSYGLWSVPAITLIGRAPSDATGYASPALSLTYVANSASKQMGEIASSGSTEDFGTSTRTTTGSTYGYWKSLTYQITNNDVYTSYFRLFMKGTGSYSDPEQWIRRTLASDSPDTVGTYDPTTNSGKVLDFISDGVGNVIWKNGDRAGANACTASVPNVYGFSLAASGSCQMTLYSRADMSYPGNTLTDPFLVVRLRNQTITNNISTDKEFKARATGWQLFFTQYVQSELAGWISLNISTL